MLGRLALRSVARPVVNRAVGGQVRQQRRKLGGPAHDGGGQEAHLFGEAVRTKL